MIDHSSLPLYDMPIDVVVAGAGIGGLFAAAKLAREGRRVLVAEQHVTVGGYAATFRRGAYTFEAGLHALDGMFDPGNPNVAMFEEFGLFDCIEFLRLPELYSVRRGNFRFDLPDGHDAAEAALITAFPVDERAVKKIMKHLRRLRKEILAFSAADTPPLLALGRLLAAPLVYPAILSSLFQTLGQYLDRLGVSEGLKLALTANAGYYHDDPYDYSMLHFGAAQYSYIAGGASYIKGGSQKLSDRMAAIIVEAGGTVLTGHMVREIFVENGRTAGVRIYDKKHDSEFRVECSVVVANAAIPEITSALLPRTQRESLLGKFGHYDISHSIFCLYFGLKKPLSGAGVDRYSTFILPPALTSLRDMAEGNKTVDFKDKILALVDYGQVDSALGTDGRTTATCAVIDEIDLWESLSPQDYAARKKQISDLLLARLEAEYPGFSDCVEYMEAATPLTMRRYTLNTRGCVYGFAQSRRQVGPKRPDNRSGIKGLYFASAWSKPGGGVSAAAKCGYTTAQMIMADTK